MYGMSSDVSAMNERIERIRKGTADAILSNATAAELAASTTTRANLGKVWAGMNAVFTGAGMGPGEKMAAMDAVSEVVERFLGRGTGWRTSANGCVFTSANELGSATEQGTRGDTTDALTRHLSKDTAATMSTIQRMKAAGKKMWGR